jgi:hypothetical protein
MSSSPMETVLLLAHCAPPLSPRSTSPPHIPAHLAAAHHDADADDGVDVDEGAAAAAAVGRSAREKSCRDNHLILPGSSARRPTHRACAS